MTFRTATKRAWITKREFIAAVKKGWKTLQYSRFVMWNGPHNGLETPNRKEVVSACAAGAACWALKNRPKKFQTLLRDMDVWADIIHANDSHTKTGEAGKKLTLLRIEKIAWPRKPRT